MKRKYLPILILLGVWALITATNFQSNTWLSGWDNLHPEFDFALNLKRAIFGVWQEHQGVGHIGGHGYAATIPHTILSWLLSLVVPINQVRFSFTILALLVGAVGAWQLLHHLLGDKLNKASGWFALVGALFYLLNYATIQQFYTPLEAFVVHYATMPWLFYLVLTLVNHWNRRNFLLFLLVSLISTTQGFIPPLFIAYSLTLGLLLAFGLFFDRTWPMLKRATIIILATFFINAYWLLPVVHFTLTGQQTYLNANNNILSTASWIETNQKYGTIKNLAILRGFLSQAVDDVEGNQTPIFAPWENHLKQTPITVMGYVMFITVLVGLLVYAAKKRKSSELAFVVIGVFTFSLLTAKVPALSALSSILEKLPLVRQAFRAGFTKLSILLALHYSIFLVFGIQAVAMILAKLFRNQLRHILEYLVVAVSSISMLIFSLPAFGGNFFYKKSHISIPASYQELLSFFKQQDPAGRIALLPIGDHWGWDVFRWGYNGSGFLWFGLRQPIMERAFDVWSTANENYYWELSYALYSNNISLIQNVLEKYSIDWVIFDTSLIPFPHPHAIFATDSIGKLLKETPSLTAVETLAIGNPQKDRIEIYKVNRQYKASLSIQLAGLLPKDSSPYEWTNRDEVFAQYGLYQKAKSEDETPSVLFPFRSLFSARPFSQPPFEILNGATSLEFKANLLPTLSISFPKKVVYDSNVNLTPRPEIKRCDTNTTAGLTEYQTDLENGQLIYNFYARSSSLCFDLYLSSLSQNQAYLATINSKNVTGSPLTLQVINGTSQRIDITRVLSAKPNQWVASSFVIPPMQPDGVGYTIRLANAAITNKPTKNDVGKIEITVLPFYESLTSLFWEKVPIQKASFSQNFVVSHPNPAYYRITLTPIPHTPYPLTLILNQAYHDGWKAYALNDKCQSSNVKCKIQGLLPFLFGKEIKEHILVNNWANGWVIQSDQSDQFTNKTIILFFLPQLLEWIGFAMLPLAFLLAFKSY